MSEIIVLAEQRGGEAREITFEALAAGRKLAEKTGLKVAALVLGSEVEKLAEQLSEYCDTVLLTEDERLSQYHSENYQLVVSHILRERRPRVLVVGHTSLGMDLAPRLAVELGFPLITDCIDVEFANGRLYATRQMYGGKLNARVSARVAEGYILTVRAGAFRPSKTARRGVVVKMAPPELGGKARVRVRGLVVPAESGVSIESADIIVAIGRGIGEKTNIPLAEELARLLGGVVACSRPIVDKGWLPPDRQVGSSGKTVKPRLYIALGISGAFQHIMGMMNSQLIIAVNKDPNAPIFNVAHYGVVDDLFKIVPALIKKIKEAKGVK
ncbi:Caffeyl-CoA reductase-Etf complex subunit CarE [Candidatus Calditenuaceae archaeon HR02]|nr:Caffeyl-CoA reductase-Etf complex subunit CarE [Candidatus Calditenuaceae archaeon HR02]